MDRRTKVNNGGIMTAENTDTIITTVSQTIATCAAAGALIFTAFQFRLNNRQQQENNRQQQENNRVQRENDRVRQLQLLENAFHQITEMEKFFHEQEAGPNGNRILYDEWARLYFYRIEWLAFMIVRDFIKDAELVNFYKENFKQWEIMFRKYAPPETQNNPKAFPHLKRLFELYNKEEEK